MNRSKINTLYSNSEVLVSLALALVCLVLFQAFPAKNGFQDITKGIFFLVIIPVVYVKYVLGKNFWQFGLNIKDKKSGLIWGAMMLIAAALISMIYIRFTSFRNHYELPSAIIDNFWYFAAYELVFINIFLFFYEFFFRGFILFTLAPHMFYWAILAQAAIYCLALIITNNFSWSMAPMITLSATSGVIAYKSKSFIFSWAAALIFMIILDAYLIHSIK